MSLCGYINHIDSELRRQSRCMIACVFNTSNVHRIIANKVFLPLLYSVFVLVSSHRESLPAIFFFFLFPPLLPTRRKSLSKEGTLRIKIAGAISRTHDIGENATEALIMADTRRAVAATTFYPLTQDSHYTNVPPIIGPQSAILPLPPRVTLPARLSITSIRIMQTDEKIKFLDPAGARDYIAKMRYRFL